MLAPNYEIDFPAARPLSTPLGDRIYSAVRGAAATQCPNVKIPTFAFSKGSGRAYAMPCGSWACAEHCAWKKRGAAKYAIEEGMRKAFWRGERVRLMTLTDGVAGSMTVADLYLAWNKLRAKLRRQGLLDRYAAVVEVQRRGALHLHVLLTGRYIAQRRLSDLALSAGFGFVTDIREVKQHARDANKSADYVSKQLAAYVSKDASRLAQKNVRRRPVRFSRNWGCSMTEAKKLLAERAREQFDLPEDPGPWIVLARGQHGALIPPKGYEVEAPEDKLPERITPPNMRVVGSKASRSAAPRCRRREPADAMGALSAGASPARAQTEPAGVAEKRRRATACGEPPSREEPCRG